MESVVSLEEVVRFGRRHWLRVLKGLGATVAIVMLYTWMVNPIYEAEARLLLRFGREYVYTSEVGDRNVAMGASKDRQTAAANSELEILRSQDLARAVVTSLGVNALYPGLSDKPQPDDPAVLSQAVARFARNVSANRIKDADVLRVTFRHGSAAMTAKALNLLVEKFRAKHLQAFSDAQATAFLDEKVVNMRKQLETAEDNLRRFQKETQSFSTEDEATILSQQRRDLEASLKGARNEIAGLEQKLSYLRSEKERAVTDKDRFAEQNSTVSEARQQLLGLQLQEQKLLSTFSETSRPVQDVRKQIQLVKDFLEQQRAAIGQGEFAENIDKQIVDGAAELRFQEARRDSLIGQLRQIDKQISSSADLGGEYRNLVREREAIAKNYEAYKQKLQEFSTFQEMDSQNITNISVIEAADMPLDPVWPRKALNLLLSIVLGLGVGLAWGFAVDFRESRNRRGAYVVPSDQLALVEPGTVHWRIAIQGSASKPGSDAGSGGGGD
jgi:uncharacterized protein involved in exopolysaccharide biosynthesis